MADLLAAARDHAERGWHVFPLKPGGKEPVVKWKERATSDHQELDAWWIGSRAYNIGIACEPSGLVVIDEDTPGEFKRICDALGVAVPGTYTVTTGKGTHHYFRAPAGDEIASANLRNRGYDVDVKASGGYVVAAGSTHQNGREYAAADPAAEVYELPVKLAAWLTRPARPTTADPFAETSQSLDAIQPGEQDDQLSRRVMGWRRRGFSEDETRALWWAVVRQSVTDPARPWTVADFERHWSGADRKVSAEEATATDALTDTPWFDVEAYIKAGMPDPPTPDVMLRTDGTGLFYAGQTNTLFGQAESGKTWVALATCAETIQAGRPAAFIDTDHNGPQQVISRLHLLGLSAGQIVANFRYREVDDASGLAALVKDLEASPVSFAVFDSVGGVMALSGASSNDPDEYRRVNARYFKRVAKTGASVLLVDHEPKDADRARSGASGTAAKRQEVGGTSLRVTSQRAFTPGQGGACTLRVHKDRPGGLRRACPVAREPLAGTFVMDARGAVRLTAPDGIGPSAAPSDDPFLSPTEELLRLFGSTDMPHAYGRDRARNHLRDALPSQYIRYGNEAWTEALRLWKTGA